MRNKALKVMMRERAKLVYSIVRNLSYYEQGHVA